MKTLISAILKFDMNTLFREKTTDSYIQFFRYIFVGGAAFLADAFTLWLCENFMYYLLAAAIAFVVGLAVNYVISVKLVFSESEKIENRFKEFMAYALIGIIGLGITEVIIFVLTDFLSVYFMISKIVAAAIVLVWNFIARKKIIYKN